MIHPAGLKAAFGCKCCTNRQIPVTRVIIDQPKVIVDLLVKACKSGFSGVFALTLNWCIKIKKTNYACDIFYILASAHLKNPACSGGRARVCADWLLLLSFSS